MIKNVLLDCDGVLYPLDELATKEIVDAMKYTYRNDVGLTPEEQKFVSEKTIAENHLGMFNYINEICRYKHYDFDEFCAAVAERIDYTHINRNKNLWQALCKTATRYNVSIFTNNSRPHLAKVLNRVFSQGIAEAKQNGIAVYDIKATEKDGYFLPKQDKEGFSSFLKKLNLQPQETILFDDAPINIERAHEAGMHAVLITAENPLIKELNKLTANIIEKNKAYE